MMKKITLFIFMLISLMGFTQELVINGDFQTGSAAPWYGNAANVVDLGGGTFVNQANVTAAGAAYTVNLSQDVALTDGLTYTLSFDAFTDATTGTRTMLAGLGQNANPWTALTRTATLTSSSQTFTYQFTINYGDAVPDRVIFDMGAATGYVFIDNVSVQETVNTCSNGIQDGDETGVDCGGSCTACITPPTTAAPTPPARHASDVVSIYSDAYSPITFDNFDAGWCTNGAPATTQIQIAGNNTLQKVSGADCQGIEFQSNKLDLSSFTHIHFDFYTNDTDLTGAVFNVKLVDFGGGSSEASALEVNINGGTTPQLVANQWVSVDVDITALGGVVANNLTRSDVAQMGITTTFLTNVWYDNIYLYKGSALSTKDFAIEGLKVYPNPAKDRWTVRTNNINMTSVQVFDMLGKNVMSLKPNTDQATINGAALRSGIYFAKIKTAEGSASVKLVKE